MWQGVVVEFGVWRGWTCPRVWKGRQPRGGHPCQLLLDASAPSVLQQALTGPHTNSMHTTACLCSARPPTCSVAGPGLASNPEHNLAYDASLTSNSPSSLRACAGNSCLVELVDWLSGGSGGDHRVQQTTRRLAGLCCNRHACESVARVCCCLGVSSPAACPGAVAVCVNTEPLTVFLRSSQARCLLGDREDMGSRCDVVVLFARRARSVSVLRLRVCMWCEAQRPLPVLA